MTRPKPALPTGDDELIAVPPYSDWAALASANRAAASQWQFTIAGRDAQSMRKLAREEAVAAGADLSVRLGVVLGGSGDPEAPIVMAGHQPEIYHPGVWIKAFLLQRLAEDMGATAIDVVVDSDGFESVGISAPCFTPEVHRCKVDLAIGTPGSYFACAPVPSEQALGEFCSAVEAMVADLPATKVRRNVGHFCELLRQSVADSHNLAELVTIARRRYEAAAGNDYRELPLTSLARTEAFATFVVDLALSAERFANAHNSELGEYRAANKVRTGAQPFPDLAFADGRYELPLWLISNGIRTGLWAEPCAGGCVALRTSDGQLAAELPSDGPSAVGVLRQAGMVIVPKALALTLFARVFCADIFIHGVGGGRYDVVTDGVCRRYYGVEPLGFVVASLTLRLPVGAHRIADEELSAARERLNRLVHNPDALLGEIVFDSAEQRSAAHALAAEKAGLLSLISAPGADKKALGLRIREVTAELGALLSPVREAYEAGLASLESQRAAADILTDRTYPFCMWTPEEIAEIARSAGAVRA
ncbi:MAG: hypothetical protein HGA39_04095 [Coriobacteriia bacterium]|nr:hypothetical protein [Coriobacteriia bacterium]